MKVRNLTNYYNKVDSTKFPALFKRNTTNDTTKITNTRHSINTKKSLASFLVILCFVVCIVCFSVVSIYSSFFLDGFVYDSTSSADFNVVVTDGLLTSPKSYK